MFYIYEQTDDHYSKGLFKIRVGHRITYWFINGIFVGLGSPLLIAIMPLLWFANRLLSPGPLFYWQTRVGMGGVQFSMLKFRTMSVDAEVEKGAVWAEENDARVTVVGQFLRRIHLDELPQIWNIVRGEMNLIGPRPERPEFVSLLIEQLPHYAQRHTIKPGLTGLAQIKCGYGASVKDTRIKLYYDLFYLQHQSWKLDRMILWRTVRQIAGRIGKP